MRDGEQIEIEILVKMVTGPSSINVHSTDTKYGNDKITRGLTVVRNGQVAFLCDYAATGMGMFSGKDSTALLSEISKRAVEDVVGRLILNKTTHKFNVAIDVGDELFALHSILMMRRHTLDLLKEVPDEIKDKYIIKTVKVALPMGTDGCRLIVKCCSGGVRGELENAFGDGFHFDFPGDSPLNFKEYHRLKK